MSPDAEAVLGFVKLLLKLLFLNSDTNGTKYMVWFFITALIYSSLTALYLISSEIRDITTLVEVLMPAIVFVLSTAKLVTLTAKRSGLNSIFEFVSTDLTEGCNYEQTSRIATAASLSYLLTRGLLVGVVVFEIFYTVMNSFMTGDGGVQLPMAFLHNLIPGDGAVVFVLNYMFQLVLEYISLLATVAADGVLLLSLLHLNAGLDVFADIVDNFEEADVIEKLRELWTYQLILIRFKNEIEHVFAGHICVQFLTSMGILCVSLYGLQGDTLVPMAIMVMLALSEIFSICFIGQLIQNKSDNITTRLYCVPWTEFRRAQAHQLMFIMLASKQPMTVSAPFVALTLRTFSQVLKTTYSLFTVLKAE